MSRTAARYGMSFAAWLASIACGGLSKTGSDGSGSGAAAGPSDSGGATGSTSGAGGGSNGGATGWSGGSSAGVGRSPDEQCNRNHDCEPGAQCIFGDCVADPKECRTSQAVCNQPRPSCPQGEVASIIDGCWDVCVPLNSCNYLDNCDLCAANDELCLEFAGQVSLYHCAERSRGCDPARCDCLDPNICGTLTCVQVEGDHVTCYPLFSEDDSSPDAGAGSDTAVVVPEPDSYLHDRGMQCWFCASERCNPGTLNCLGSDECSHRHGCLVSCAELEGESLEACQLGCFDGDGTLMARTLDGLECLGERCCSECGTPCP